MNARPRSDERTLAHPLDEAFDEAVRKRRRRALRSVRRADEEEVVGAGEHAKLEVLVSGILKRLFERAHTCGHRYELVLLAPNREQRAAHAA